MRYILLLFFYFITAMSFAQLPLHPSNEGNGNTKTFQIYDSLLGENLPVLNGVLYKDYRATLSAGHPFYNIPNPVKGKIEYDGIVYKNLSLLLDIVKENLIINNNNLLVIVIKERLSDFSIANERFKFLPPKNIQKIPSGFYKILFQGTKTAVYARPIKTIAEDLTNGRVAQLLIKESINYYISKNNKFQKITNKRMLVNLLKDEKREVKKFLRENHFSTFEEQIAATTAFYEKL